MYTGPRSNARSQLYVEFDLLSITTVGRHMCRIRPEGLILC